MPSFSQTGLIAGVLLFLILMQMPPPNGLGWQGWVVFSISLWMAIWWITEAAPLAVTALLPLILFPLFGLGDIKSIGGSYASNAVFLALGGFVIGLAIQRWNLHIRIAMRTVELVGTEPRRVVGGFMIASAFLSMWITNTATTVMMLPIAYSVAVLIDKEGAGEETTKQNFGVALMLGLAYSASIGGMMTLVGTSTNVMFKGYFEENFGFEINFIDWMLVGMPIGVLLLIIVWWMLSFIIFPCKMIEHEGIRRVVNKRLEDLGGLSIPEKRTLFVFMVTATLWIGKGLFEPYFGGLQLNDASIAIFGATLLFVIPADRSKGIYLLNWDDTKDVPWGILLLLGGGLTLAAAMNDFGVANWIGSKISQFRNVPTLLLVLITVAMIIMLSELMSNVATLTAFLPVIVAMAIGFGEHPFLFALPAAFAASCAFMLPIATPPNAIVFGSGFLSIPQMARTGAVLNIIAIFVLTIMCFVMGVAVFEIELGVLPEFFEMKSR